MDCDGLFDISRVRFASGIDGEDPKGILMFVEQACHHIVEVGALLRGLIGWNPLHSTGLLILDEVAKDATLPVMAGQLPPQADRVLGLIVGLGGHWRAGTHCEDKISQTVNNMGKNIGGQS